jgi:hypothetical protein
MRCNIEMHQTAAIMLDDDKHEQNLEQRCRNGEEVDGSHLCRMVLQECSPRLRRRLWVPDQVFANRGLGNLNAQFEKFTVNSGRSPTGIVSAQRAN